MGRLKPIAPSKLNQEQRALFNAITKGKRAKGTSPESFLLDDGGLRGPFNAWLHAPNIGQPAQRLGEALRFETHLSPKLRELAILTVAARWRADYEWWAHSRIAKTAGLGDEIITALKNGTLPGTAEPSERAVYRFAVELMETQSVTEEAYRAAVSLLGGSGTVELVTLLGYYVLVSMVLNAFEVEMPQGEPRPFA